MSDHRLSYAECRDVLRTRLAERPPTRLQVLTGPRQVGKTTLLLELARAERDGAVYFPGDGPEATLPGAWERLWQQADSVAREIGRCVVLIDEAHLVHDWASRLKGEWDRVERLRLPIHVVATGSSALRLAPDPVRASPDASSG
ncbi:MAG: AAA family ATPase [Chloroflexi bacterium]|nr:AAA family ATPase [Chloroflexota bacterium]